MPAPSRPRTLVLVLARGTTEMPIQEDPSDDESLEWQDTPLHIPTPPTRKRLIRQITSEDAQVVWGEIDGPQFLA